MVVYVQEAHLTQVTSMHDKDEFTIPYIYMKEAQDTCTYSYLFISVIQNLSEY